MTKLLEKGCQVIALDEPRPTQLPGFAFTDLDSFLNAGMIFKTLLSTSFPSVFLLPKVLFEFGYSNEYVIFR